MSLDASTNNVRSRESSFSPLWSQFTLDANTNFRSCITRDRYSSASAWASKNASTSARYRTAACCPSHRPSTSRAEVRRASVMEPLFFHESISFSSSVPAFVSPTCSPCLVPRRNPVMNTSIFPFQATRGCRKAVAR